jgi:hypothetical protein
MYPGSVFYKYAQTKCSLTTFNLNHKPLFSTRLLQQGNFYHSSNWFKAM